LHFKGIKIKAMKNSRLLSMVAFAILMVVMVSCTTIRDASGGYEDGSSRRRVYYEDPRYGNTIILERDPYTGQLYEVSPFGYSPFNNYGYGYRYNNPYNYNRGRYYNGRGSTTTKPSTPRAETRRNFDDARSKVLGDKKQ
jgi:hypothetical protein